MCTHTQAFQSYLYVPPSMRSLYLGHVTREGGLLSPPLRLLQIPAFVLGFGCRLPPGVNHHTFGASRVDAPIALTSQNAPVAGWCTHFVSRKALTIGRVECGLIGLVGRLLQQNTLRG